MNLVYWWAGIRNASEQSDVDKFDRTLWTVPLWYRLRHGDEPIPDESPWSAANETAALGAFAAQIGQGGPPPSSSGGDGDERAQGTSVRAGSTMSTTE